jgi:CO/xanthine dehydrogenase FAD-binding subunit
VATISGYRRPSSLGEAAGLLEAPDAVVLAGGTWLNSAPTAERLTLVDLQALGLSGVERVGDGRLRIGAMTTLQQVVEASEVPTVLRDAARREEPSTLRAAATVGGCVARAEPTSEFLAALLVHEGTVTLTARGGEFVVPLAGLFADMAPLGGRIITSVAIETGGAAASARTGRSRADRAIVAAVARRGDDRTVRLAMTGVAATPVLVESVEELDPPGDFRGSSGYRRSLAAILAARALEAVA